MSDPFPAFVLPRLLPRCVWAEASATRRKRRGSFRLLDVAVIEAAVRPDDPASIAVLHRLGMRRVGERLVHASARRRDEWCLAYEAARPDA